MADSPVTQQPKRTERLQQQYQAALMAGRENLHDFRPSVIAWLSSAARRRGYFRRAGVILPTFRVSPFRCETLAEYQAPVSDRVIDRHMFMRRLMRARYRRMELQGVGFIHPLP